MTGSSTMLKSAAAGLIMLLMSKSALAGESIMQLPACPDTPNCVSSQALETAHFIAPIPYSGSPDATLQRLKSVLATIPRLSITVEQDNYLRAEVRSRVFRFVDDIEFLLDTEQQLIHVRSASRSGYSDFGVNRRRVGQIHKAFMRTP
jgi:uncharacterized protein (DUF1499 family)